MNSLCHKYAIEPGAIRDYRDFRYIFEKFGFHQGRLMVRVPGSWEKLLLESCPDPVDRQRIVERLRKFGAQRLVMASAIGSEKPRTWLEHVEAVHKRDNLAGAVTETAIGQRESLPPTIRLVDCDEDFLPEIREDEVRRTAEEISEVARPLFHYSSRVVVVDPYFNPFKTQCRSSLGKFLQVARQERCEHIDVVSTDEWINRRTAAEELGRRIEPLYGAANSKPVLRFFFLPRTAPGIEFHHRFILSTFGGIRFDAGVAAESFEKRTDVILVGRERHERLLEVYGRGAGGFPGAFIWEWPNTNAGYRHGVRR